MKQAATAKRRHESHWQYQARLARERQEARDRMEPIVPKEARSQGGYVEEDVMHVETGTRAVTFRRRSLSSLVRMHQLGTLDNAQFEAAIRIARIAERIGSDASVRCNNLAARVDCSSTSRDALVERLNQVRDEMTYTRWRRLIPLPRRMILDMVLVDRPLATTARIYGRRWESRNGIKGGRETFVDALDLWNDLRERVGKDFDERDLMVAHARIALAA